MPYDNVSDLPDSVRESSPMRPDGLPRRPQLFRGPVCREKLHLPGERPYHLDQVREVREERLRERKGQDETVKVAMCRKMPFRCHATFPYPAET